MKSFGCNFPSNFANPTPDSLLLFINKKTHQKINYILFILNPRFPTLGWFNTLDL